MSASKGQCRCLGALTDITKSSICQNAVLTTGLTWADMRELRCVRRACLFCESVERDYACEDAPARGRREHRDPPQERRHRRRSRHFAGGREFSTNAELVFRFTIGETSPGGYDGLLLSTELTSRDHKSLKGSGNQPLEAVGCFQRKYSGYLERRLVTSQFNPAILRNWLADCEHNHESAHWAPGFCHDRAVASLATLISLGRLRLIDVSTHTLVTATAPERYLALSYVWGESGVSRDGWLPSSAYEICGRSESAGYAFQTWEALPRTIREAADVVESIGERYLWVDALCINQTDPMDRQHIVAEMGAIYGSSLVTILATGDHANTGLPGVSPGSRAGEVYEEMPLGDTTIQLVSSLPVLDQELGKSTWSTRGWTFQEFYLSERVVVFSPSQVYFICAEGEQAEAYAPGGLLSGDYWQRRIHRHQTLASLDDDVAHTMIEDFCDRNLTHCQDRFNAFMGFATLQTIGRDGTEEAIALRGLPSNSFWGSLLWSPRGSEVPTRIRNNLDNSLALPSWSWVGWTGPITMPGRRPKSRDRSKFWVDTTLLDNANIVLKAEDADRSSLWEPWPFEPEPYLAKIPNTVTLHMWAPCVDCHLISMEGMKTCPVRYPPLEGGQTVCHMIIAATFNMTIDILDELARECVNPEGRKDFIGFIWRQRDSSRARPHRQIHQMVVFPWERREKSSLILLEENPDDPGTVCRAAIVDGPRLFVGASGLPHTPGEQHPHKFQHRYIRMQ